MPNEEKPIETKLRATFGSKVTPDEFEKFEAAWTVAQRANTSETNKPVRWSTPEGRANMLLAQITNSVLVWAIRQPAEIQADDKELLKALREKYAKVKSQEAYQQDWANISQQPGEKFDDYYNRLEVAYDNAYREPEFCESKVKSRLLAEKFRDSIRDLRARESILDKGILDDTGKLKDSGVIIAIAKRANEVGDLLKSSPTVALAPPLIRRNWSPWLIMQSLHPYSVGGPSHPTRLAEEMTATSTGIAIIVTRPTIQGGGRPDPIDKNTTPPGCHDDRNQRQIEYNNSPESSPLTRIFPRTRNRGCRLRTVLQITHTY